MVPIEVSAGCSKRPSREAAARSATRRIMSVTFADAGEAVSRQCLRGRIVIIFTRPPRACRDKLFSRGRTLRCARRRISRLKFAHGRETVSAQCPLSDARTMLAVFFNTLLEPIADAFYCLLVQASGIEGHCNSVSGRHIGTIATQDSHSPSQASRDSGGVATTRRLAGSTAGLHCRSVAS